MGLDHCKLVSRISLVNPPETPLSSRGCVSLTCEAVALVVRSARLPCVGGTLMAVVAENFSHWMTESFRSEHLANTSGQPKASIRCAGWLCWWLVAAPLWLLL
jgi:hypothetical protein